MKIFILFFFFWNIYAQINNIQIGVFFFETTRPDNFGYLNGEATDVRSIPLNRAKFWHKIQMYAY